MIVADVAVDLIHATVQLEASYGDGTRNVGTGFLVNAPATDGRDRIVLVTATHVMSRMPGRVMTIGYRTAESEGGWAYTPRQVEIRRGPDPLWATAQGQDVAVIEVEASPEIVRAAIPLAWLADETGFERYQVGPGYEMMTLGYPWGLASNGQGFPILRAGKVASYPVAPSAKYPTFLLDFSVFPGNSGGPVFVRTGDSLMIAGLMTQQLEAGGQRLEIGVVTQARYIRDAITALDGPSRYPRLARTVGAAEGAGAVAVPASVAANVNSRVAD